ncbi:VOC family protein [Streptomyces sp. NBC_00670]|jgi:catechol 2,3-dioxygenase-like lactoylglutathione lyase family enzyme|uniref:VOC family protein n=1 Tax=Streptomyces sp. NBC_00670 TaxID=2975804 RepID=UPI002E34316B|nr:VOC family protein [Streptomyces sp. NBC_00670]
MTTRLDHIGVNVRDLPAQTAWYREAFELKPVFEFHLDGPGLGGVVLEHPHGWRLELLARPGSAPGLRAPDPLTAALTEGYGHFALTTPDLDPLYARLLAHGAAEAVAPGPSPEPGVRMAWVRDPEGNLIELMEKKESERKPEGSSAQHSVRKPE